MLDESIVVTRWRPRWDRFGPEAEGDVVFELDGKLNRRESGLG